MEKIKRIIFVCTGNTCRSPMAEHLLRDMIENSEELAKDNWEILSAGISAIKGVKASDKTEEVMRELNLDLSDHISRNIETIELKKSDIILTMSRKHSRFLILDHTDLADNIFTLKEFAENKNGKDIEDPFGLSLQVYRDTRDEIKLELEKILQKLKDFNPKEKD
ncbi:MAG: low molecular weight protein arginine phosphatase [Halanaerobiales bacterium]|nr:low molecular weight protein arginine phosphatase [Halanaerobiales bacterium]